MPAYGSVIDDVSSSDAGGPNEGAADAAGSKNFLERNYTTLVALLGCVALLGLNVQPRSPDVDLSGREPSSALAAEPSFPSRAPPSTAGAPSTENPDPMGDDGNVVPTTVVDGIEYEHMPISLLDNDVLAKYAKTQLAANLPIYLPDSVDIFWNKNLTQGDIGETASEGYVALSIAHGDFALGTIDAAFTLIVTLDGDIVEASVAPTFTADELNGQTYFKRFEGLKMKDSETLMLAGNADLDGGGFYEWKFSEDGSEVTPSPFLQNVSASSHDIQYFQDEDMYLVIGENLDRVLAFNGNGTKLWEHICDSTRPSIHFNHAQLVRDDNGELAVYISVRDFNSVQKVNFTNGEVIWELGGKDGLFNITDIDGTQYAPFQGHSPWNHQHNAEYVGGGRIAMFDNGYNGSMVRHSRMLLLDVNEEDKSAEVVWEWSTGVHSLIFGDCDILPSENIVGTFWPSTVHTKSVDIRSSYEAVAVEVTRNGSMAWMMGVRGTNVIGETEYTRYSGEAPIGWAMYSVERVYSDMIVNNVAVNTGTGEVSFDVFNTYRQGFDLASVVTVTCDSVVVAFDITVLPHWQKTTVFQTDTTLIGIPSTECIVEVVSDKGDSVSHTTPVISSISSATSADDNDRGGPGPRSQAPSILH